MSFFLQHLTIQYVPKTTSLKSQSSKNCIKLLNQIKIKIYTMLFGLNVFGTDWDIYFFIEFILSCHVMSYHSLFCVHIYANVYHCRFIMLDLAFPCVHIYIYYCRYTILDLAVQCVHNVSFMYSKPHLVFHLKFNWVSHLQNRSYVEVSLTYFQQPFLICYWNYIQVEFDQKKLMLEFNVHWKSAIWKWKESWKYFDIEIHIDKCL